jgi:signal transduction histidine kinase
LLVIEDVTRQHQRDRVYSDFVRNAAHQLRTPTAAISSAVEVLQGGAKEIPADRDHFLDHIERETNRLTRLTQALLVLARADAGVQPPRLEFVPLKPLLEDVVAGLATRPETSIDLSCDGAIAVFVERDLAEQAFQAILENAVRHCREGAVSVRAWNSGKGRVAVEVDDPGEGILPEHIERIHEPFYRAAIGTEGFGLGLAIASRALSVLDGSLRIHSAPGQGTQVTIELPSAQVTNT